MTTNQYLLLAAFAVGGYLLGSLSPAKFLAKRFAHQDIHKVGSGNAGSTNVLRTMGWSMGLLNFVLDCCKGMTPSLLALLVPEELYLYCATLGGTAAVVGHVWPLFSRFRGGKGVATFFGAAVAIRPLYALAILGIFLVMAISTGYVSLATITAVLGCAAVAVLWPGLPLALRIFCVAMPLLICYTHRSNIVRLLQHKENRMHFRKIRWKQY